jgi:hypothetical protein
MHLEKSLHLPTTAEELDKKDTGRKRDSSRQQKGKLHIFYLCRAQMLLNVVEEVGFQFLLSVINAYYVCMRVLCLFEA